MICLLTNHPDPGDNAACLEPALAGRGLKVVRAPIDSLHLEHGRVRVSPVDGRASVALDDLTLLWTLGFGGRSGFLDKMQLLALTATPQVTRPEALLLWHAKYALAIHDSGLPHPPTWAYNTPTPLIEHARTLGGRFVLKPPGGSFGRGIVVADGGSARLEWAARTLTRNGAWCLLQRFIPEVADGELRVLVAGGRVIGGYQRLPTGGAANLARGGAARPAELDPGQQALAASCAGWLADRGIGFAGIDLAGGMILEVNIVNPGGLSTLAGLGAGNLAPAVVDAVLAALNLH